MHDKVSIVFKQALSEEDATVPFAGDLENPTYLTILATIRSFNPENYPDPVVDGEKVLSDA
jgi:hypothetical protein